jgi:site-specific DNA-adenine methylase
MSTYSPIKSQKTSFTQYAIQANKGEGDSNSFDEKQHNNLVDLAEKSSAKGIPFIIQNIWSKETKSLYQKSLDRKILDVTRHISCRGDGRIARREVIVLY